MPRIHRTCAALVALLAPVVSAGVLDVGTPIKVQDELGLARSNELVRVSFPIAESENVKSTDSLLVLDSTGAQVPVQWRVLTRWKGVPADTAKPIRFALAEFPVDLAAGQAKQFGVRLRTASDAPMPAPAKPVTMTTQGDIITVSTGVARFDFSKSGFTLWNGVYLDLDKDGVPEVNSNEQVVKPATGLGAALIDPFGGVYLGLLTANTVYTVEESGPLQLVLRVDGKHLPFSGPVLQRDYLKFSTRLTFTAGSAAVGVEHILKNTYLDQPMGAISFARYLLHTRLSASGPLTARFGGDDLAPPPPALPLTNPTLEAFLLQDSPGGSNWNQSGTTFEGWRLYQSAPTNVVQPEALPAGPPVLAGSRSAGWMDVSDASKGMMVAIRFPWENYPFALRAYSDGSMITDLWPAEFAGVHWLDDCQRKSSELFFQFHEAAFDPSFEATRLTHPLRPIVSINYLRYTDAWADQGDIRGPTLTFDQMKAEGQADLDEILAGADSAGGYGWAEFGEVVWAKNTHAVGSPRNKLTFFDQFMMSGATPWFMKNEIFARHSMDIRPYHIDGFDIAQHPNANLPEGIPYGATDMLGRDTISPALDPYKVGIPSNGHGWNGFDGEHMVIDDVYEYYLLTGSYSALDAMNSVGQAMLTWKLLTATQDLHSSRYIGWTLRALMKIRSCTGDSRLLDRAQKIVSNVKTYYGNKKSPVTGITYHYLARQIYGGGSHNMTKDYDLPWQIAVGIYGLGLYYRETGDQTVVKVIGDVAGYIADYCVQNGVVVDALACDNHLDFNAKPSNNGVNTWIPSALAIAYRLTGNQKLWNLCKLIYEQNDTGFASADEYYHWYHSAAELLGKP